MAQFPLALAIEPRLLPLAVANGFQMDSKVSIYSSCFSYSLTYAYLVSRFRLPQNV